MDFDPYAEKMYPWGMLTQEQQDLIKAEGPWQRWIVSEGWVDTETVPQWCLYHSYRRKPKPKAKRVVILAEWPDGKTLLYPWYSLVGENLPEQAEDYVLRNGGTITKFVEE